MSTRTHAAAGRARPQRTEVREALLDAALEEFAQVGYGAASVESIARRAGLTKGAVQTATGVARAVTSGAVRGIGGKVKAGDWPLPTATAPARKAPARKRTRS